jgi:hypothetical protein
MPSRNRSQNGGAAGLPNVPNGSLGTPRAATSRAPLARVIPVLIALAICAIMVVSGLYAINPEPTLANRVSALAAPAAGLVPAAVSAAPVPSYAAPAGSIPGSNPQDNFALPPATQMLSAPAHQTQALLNVEQELGERLPINTSEVPYLVDLQHATGAAAPVAPPTAPKQTATVDGTLKNALPPYAPISSAQVSVQPVGADCQNDTCPPVQSKASGYFNATILEGSDELLIVAGEFVTNYTVITNVSAGQAYHLGTLYMTPDAHVVGYVESDLSPHNGIANIGVQGTSRDGKVEALPSAVTSGSGFYNTTVPPGPSIIEYSPVGGQGIYISTSRFVDLPPGGWVELNITYLEQGVIVQVKAYDRQTNHPISSGDMYSITACQRTAPSTCFPQGTAVCGGGTAQAVGFPGADLIKVEASPNPDECGVGPEFVTNFTYMNVPVSSGTKVVNLGRVNLVEMGGGEFSSTISWGGSNNAAWKKWHGGLEVVEACSLDGFSEGTVVQNQFGGFNTSFSGCDTACTSGYPALGVVTDIFPLRNSVVVSPDDLGICQPPLPTWLIPGYTPVTDNFTVWNGTAGATIQGGWLNLTPGTYIQGEVLPAGTEQGTTASIGEWTVSAIPTDEDTKDFAMPSATNETGAQSIKISYYYVDELPAGCDGFGGKYLSNYFCVPAPPGPSQLEVTSTLYLPNTTAVNVPAGTWSVTPLPLSDSSARQISVIQVVRGQIHGHAYDQGGGPLAGFPTVTVGPAGSASWPTQIATLNQSGAYATTAPPGWDVVTVSAPDYVTNQTWIYVNDSGWTDVPTIYLSPLADLSGRVIGLDGQAVNSTSVTICRLTQATESGCANAFGNGGLSNTNGTYWAFVPAAHIPVGVYEVKATAPGYITNETWVNVTVPGSAVEASTIVLEPISTPINQAPLGFAVHGATGAVLLGAEWIYGSMVDNSTGNPLPGTVITVVPVGGGSQFSIGTNNISGNAEFNFSLSIGQYWLWFNDSGYYYPYTTFLTVNGFQAGIDLGAIHIVPFGWLTGQVVVDPWRQVVTWVEGVGVHSTVTACEPIHNLGQLCGAAATTDTSGGFNVSAPLGNDTFFTVGAGGGFESGTEGFMENDTVLRVGPDGFVANESEATAVNGNFVIGEVIFATYAGLVLDNTTHNETPVRFADVSVDTELSNWGNCPGDTETNGGGVYVELCFPGNVTNAKMCGTSYVCTNFSYHWPASTFPNDQFNWTFIQNYSAGRTLILNTTSLVHFGWIDFYVNASVLPYGTDTVRVAGAGGGDSVTNQFNIQSSGSGLADGGGFVNMTAPPGGNVTLSFGGGVGDFNGTTVKNISVNSSATTFINGTSFTDLGNISILPWSWVNGTVWDPALNVSIPGATIAFQNHEGQTNAANIQSNGLGYFFSDSPPGDGRFHNATAAFTAPGYETNNTNVSVEHGQLTVDGPVNLVAYGVIAGVALGDPGNVPLYGATVTVCGYLEPICNNAPTSTNGSGAFWVEAPPGRDIVNVSLTGFASNTSILVNVHPDEFLDVGTLVLAQFATVTGNVLGTPTGHPLQSANVSICSTLAIPGSPTGPCFITVLSGAGGSFTISTQPGKFILAVNYTGYNATYVTLVLNPGEQVNLGVVFLWQFGTIAGTILGQDTDLPIANATVQACPLWSAGNCTTVEFTSPSGAFRLTAPSGGYLLTASSSGYLTRYVDVVSVSGIVTTVLPIYLEPQSTNTIYAITGTVEGGTQLTPLAGAVVSAGPDFATATNALGMYTLNVPWGVYLVSAQANSYTTEGRSVAVHGDLTGIDFVLPVASYSVSGTVRDGLTDNPLGNVFIYDGVELLTTTNGVGAFSTPLPNGTTSLTAQAAGALASDYAPVNFTVVINGASVTREVLMYPAAVEIYGLVVSSVSGEPIGNLTVTVNGTTADGIPWSNHYATNALGTYVAQVYVGTYTISAVAGGYSSASRLVHATTPGAETITLSLTPISIAATTPLGIESYAPLAAIAALAAIVIAGALLLRQRRR